MTIKFWVLPLIFGSLQGFFLIGLLGFSKQGDNQQKIYLILLTFCISYIIGYMAIFLSDELIAFPHLIYTASGFWYLLGPLFYLYTKSLFSERFKWWDVIHFIPFLNQIKTVYPFYLLSADDKIDYFVTHSLNVEFTYVSFTHYLLTSIYVLVSYRIMKRQEHDLKMEESTSLISRISHHKKMTFILGLSILILYFAIIFAVFVGAYGIEFDYVGLLCLTTLIFSLNITAIKDPGVIFFENRSIHEISSSVSINDQQLKHFEYTIEKEKPYLDPNLNLRKLSDLTDLTIHQLSTLLNNYYKKNFYDFINNLRIAEVKQRLKDPVNKNLTILAIAYESGFNSKASFNRIFKKMTGMTPTSFIRSSHD